MREQRNKQKLNIWYTKAPMDTLFLVLVLILLAIGLVMVFSASFATAFFNYKDSYYFIKKQLAFAVLGLVAMFIIGSLDYSIFKLAAIPIYAISVFTLILVRIMPSSAKGAGRWLELGIIRFQPSELAKLGVILLLAVYISVNYNNMKNFKTGIIYPGLIMFGIAALVVIQPHLSGTALIVSIGLTLMVVGGTDLKALGLLSGGFLALGIAVISMFGYMQDRIAIWRNPASDPLGDGFQTLQSLYAIGSGGLFGLGLGRSRQKYLYIPEPQNDFIFSIVCEELGFIGAMLIMLIFAFLCYRGFVIAWSAKDKFGSLLVVGVMTQVAVQTILNIAVVTNTIPVTGVSLPFFSSGGTALVMLLAQMGIVLAVSRKARLKRD